MIDANSFQIPFIQPMDAFVNLNFVAPSQLMQFGNIRQFA